MRTIEIPKRSGGVRVVVCPDRRRRDELRLMLPRLEAAAMVLDVHDVQHGFTPGRSPVTCASVHVGYEWSVTFDLADCFDHVTERRVRQFLEYVSYRCFVDGVARQGLPTSPALANIALSGLDADIVAWLGGRGAYTRYADDMTVSTDDRAVIEEARTVIPESVMRHGHEVNPRKTRVQWSGAGRRIVVGIGVGDDGIHPTRRVKRRLRATRHQQQDGQAAGLAEWAALRRPNALRLIRERMMPDGQDHDIDIARAMLNRLGNAAPRD